MFKILMLLFIVFTVSRATLRFKDGSISLREYLFWLGLWTTASILFINPDISNFLAKLVGVGRGADTIFYLSIILIFYAIFRIYVKIEKLDKDITELSINISNKIHVISKK